MMYYWKETFVDPNEVPMSEDVITAMIGPPRQPVSGDYRRWDFSSSKTECSFSVTFFRETRYFGVFVMCKADGERTKVLIAEGLLPYEFRGLLVGLQIDTFNGCQQPCE